MKILKGVVDMATLEDVYGKLDTLGYAVVPEDDVALTFILDAVENEVLNKCNISDVPDELDCVVIDAVAGRFLMQKHNMGLLEKRNFITPVKSISEGDTSITYEVSSEKVYMDYLSKLSELPIGMLAKYRRLPW